MLKPFLLLALLTCHRMLGAEIQVTDDLGLPVTLNQAAERVVALAPHAAELLLAAGAGSKLVGLTAFHDYPEQIRQLPVVSHFSGLDRERMIMLKPDLVIAWASGNKQNDIAWLKAMGIAVYLSEPATLEDIPLSMEKLGRLTGQEQSARQAARKFRADLDQSCADRTGQPPKAAYYEIWPSPPMTIGGRHWLNTVLGKAGLHNVFADQDRQIISVTPEALLARPVAVRISSFQQTGTNSATGKLVRGNEQLARPGPRIIEGLRLLCGQL